MQFLKKHFEKIILSAVLVGLGAAAFWLSIAVTEEKKLLTEGFVSPPPAKPLPGVESNLALLRGALQTLTNAPSLSLSGEHNLFNPVTWKRTSDGKLFKMTRSGVDALVVTNITPLYFTITLDSKVGEGYRMIAQPPKVPKRPNMIVRVGQKPSPFQPFTILSATNGAPGNPSPLALTLLIPETKQTVTLTTNAPYRRLVGYEADLLYSGSDTTNPFPKKGVDDLLRFSGESFKIIDIASNSVTVQDARTAQKTEKEWSGGR